MPRFGAALAEISVAAQTQRQRRQQCRTRIRIIAPLNLFPHFCGRSRTERSDGFGTPEVEVLYTSRRCTTTRIWLGL
jgi:hypothetical protein